MRRFLCALFLSLLFSATAAAAQQECVILLHGLLRSARVMRPLEAVVNARGYLGVNVDYDSRQAPIPALAASAIRAGLSECRERGAQPVHFITHSMGGILLRAYLADFRIPELGNSVMIAPPNQGSEIIDRMGDIPGLDKIIGPAGTQLSTEPTDPPRQLGPANFPVGIIAGDRSWNPLFSHWLPQTDDGRVALSATRLAGMRDYLVLHGTHNGLLSAPQTAEQALFFLRNGRFEHSAAVTKSD